MLSQKLPNHYYRLKITEVLILTLEINSYVNLFEEQHVLYYKLKEQAIEKKNIDTCWVHTD